MEKGKNVSESISLSALIEISVTGAEGQIFVYSAGTKGVLAVIAPKGGNAGLVHFEARQVDKDVGDLFERRSPASSRRALIRDIGSYSAGRSVVTATRRQDAEALARFHGIDLGTGKARRQTEIP